MPATFFCTFANCLVSIGLYLARFVLPFPPRARPRPPRFAAGAAAAAEALLAPRPAAPALAVEVRFGLKLEMLNG